MGKVNRNSSSNDFAPVPEGTYQAVVVDCVDLGWIEKTFQGQSQGLKPHVQLVYQVGGVTEDANGDEYEPMREDGKPWLVFGRRLVLSMNERAGFYKEVAAILGTKKLEEMLEADEFDTEDLVGRNVQFSIVHNEGSQGGIFANVENMAPWAKRFGPYIEPRDYTRRHDRENYVEPEYSAFGPAPKATNMSEGTGQRAAPVTQRPQQPQRTAQEVAQLEDERAKFEGEKGVAKNVPMPKRAEAAAPVAAYPDVDDDDPFADA